MKTPAVIIMLTWRIYASGNLVIIRSGNGLSPVRRQAITINNADLLSFGSLGINPGGIRIKIQPISFR